MLRTEGSSSPDFTSAVALDMTGDTEDALFIVNKNNKLCIDPDSGEIAEKLFSEAPFGMAYHPTPIKPQ